MYSQINNQLRKNQLIRALVILLLAVPVFADDAQVEGQVEEGAELYAEFCASCHGDNKSGLAEFKDDQATFNDRLEGMTQEMPDFAGFFEQEEIDAMFAYLSADSYSDSTD
jgi:mono/diheme cytochrome c family protein